MYHHVTPFLKRANSFESSCSLRNGLIDLIKKKTLLKFLNFFFFSCLQEPLSVLSIQIDSQKSISSIWLVHIVYLVLPVQSILKQHLSRIHQHSFHTGTITFINNTTIVFSFISNLKQ